MRSTNKNQYFPSSPKILILLRAAQNNIGWFSHHTKLANLRVENTSFQSSTKCCFSVGVVMLLSYWCHRSPGFFPIMDIPEQHEIKKTLLTNSMELNILKLMVIISICIRHKILKQSFLSLAFSCRKILNMFWCCAVQKHNCFVLWAAHERYARMAMFVKDTQVQNVEFPITLTPL